MKIKHLMYTPFTGLGLHNGFRGNGWLKNRIKVFKQFVVPSLQAQTSKNFTLWISWRREEKRNPYVIELMKYMEGIKEFKTIHTFSGLCFYDDKFEYEEARLRLINNIHSSMADLINEIGEADKILMSIQPSDDCYHKEMVEVIQNTFWKHPKFQAIGFKNGYMCNYLTKEVAEYNPETNPPFYTIKFPREDFTDPLKHLQFTSMKEDCGKYKKGTPLPSHEYVGNCLNYAIIDDMRGFLVGCHGVNISTTFTNPYKGGPISSDHLADFGLADVPPLKIYIGPVKKLLSVMPYKVQRKLRYIFSEWKLFKLSTYPGLLK